MMKTPLRLSVHPARFFSLSPGRRLALLSLLCLLLLTGGLDAASFERLASLVQLVNDGTQINIAQVDVLAKSFYACVPEPAAEALPAALASAKLRHARFQRAVKKDAQGIE